MTSVSLFSELELPLVILSLPELDKTEKQPDNNATPNESEKESNGDAVFEILKQAYYSRKVHEESHNFHKEIVDGRENIHQIAMKNPFLNQLIEGTKFCAKAYGRYLCKLYVMHEALEKLQAKIVKEYGEGFFVFPELYRSSFILEDIKTWVVFNELKNKFDGLEVGSKEYIEKVKEIANDPFEPSPPKELEEKRMAHVRFAEHLEELCRSKESCIIGIGNIFAIYGTLRKGGFLVKHGVTKGYEKRLEEAKILEIVIEPRPCVRLFTFSEKTPTLEKWYENLNEIPNKLQFKTTEDEKIFKEKVIKEVIFSIQTVLDFIEGMNLTITC